MTEEDIFLAALDRRPVERPAYLDDACGEDADLRGRVEALLRSHDDAESFLGRPAVEQVVGLTPSAGTTPDPSTAEVPERLGTYRVLELIGRGGMGAVYRAFDEKLQRVVAIKVLAAELAASATARRRFVREARAAAAVCHEHVVAVHAVEEDHRPPFLVMQFIDGISLQEKIDRAGPLEVREILRIGLQTAEGLAAAHRQGLVHRDVKPSNILLENGVERVKLTDFGLARAADDASLTQSGVIAGTPQYMSPEQADGRPVDARSDLFSLGSVLYAMCTGRPPFRASGTMGVLKRVCEEAPRPIREVSPEIPDWLCAIVERLHAKRPEDRFQSAREVADLLAQHLTHLQQPSRVPMPAPVARPPAPARPRHHLLWAVAAAVLMGPAAAAFFAGETLIRFTANRGELILDDVDPALAVTVVQHGTVVYDRSTRREFELPADDRTEIRVVSAATGAELFRKDFAVHRGKRTRINVAAELAAIEERNRASVSDDLARIGRAVAEPPTVGWVQLFNGKDLTGWKREGDGRGWVEKGLLREPGLLRTTTAFENYVLRCQFRYWYGSERANEHLEVLLHMDPAQIDKQDQEAPAPGQKGCRHILARLWPNGKGDVFGSEGAKCRGEKLDGKSKPRDEWRELTITSRDGTLEFELDGERIGKASGCEPRCGYVGLIGEVEFRKIEIQELPKLDGGGFVPLFNGKDLSGWEYHPNQPGDWKVEGGELVGSGRKSHLFSGREYEDFHLRFEAKLIAGGDSGVIVRAPFFVTPEGGRAAAGFLKLGGEGPWGYEAQITGPRTGIVLAGEEVFGDPVGLTPDTWFTGEVIATGNRIVVRINGTTTANFEDPRRRYPKGRVALQVWDPKTVVRFRKVEIRELPPADAGADPRSDP